MSTLNKFLSSPSRDGVTRIIQRCVLNIVVCVLTLAANDAISQSESLIEFIKQTEIELDARVGVSILVPGSEPSWEYKGDERFPMTSTFKTIACAALLHRADAGLDSLDRVVTFDESDLVTYSPITEKRVEDIGMSLAELCEATITVSDNTAGNLILGAIGGPTGFTEFSRSLGDRVTRLDRWEPGLNEAIPGDPRDTTSPNAMAGLLEKLVFGDVLTSNSRRQLTSWLKGNLVGDTLLRAGIPNDWQIGDKTGAGNFGSRTIAAVMWPPSSAPVIATIYITETEATFEERNEAIAQIGRVIVEAMTN